MKFLFYTFIEKIINRFNLYKTKDMIKEIFFESFDKIKCSLDSVQYQISIGFDYKKPTSH